MKCPNPAPQPTKAAARTLRALPASQTSAGMAANKTQGNCAGGCAALISAPAAIASSTARRPNTGTGRTRAGINSAMRLFGRLTACQWRRRQGLVDRDAKALDLARIGIDHLEFMAIFVLDDLAPRRHMVGQLEDEPAKRVDLLLPTIGQKMDALGLLEFADIGTSVDEIDTLGFANPGFGYVDIVFILDIADDLSDQILDGDEAIDTAEFVDHQRHVDALSLHLLQKSGNGHGRRYETGRADQLRQAEFAVLGPKAEF